jgi:hypothetical protein
MERNRRNLLFVYRCCQAVSTLCASALEDVAAVFGCHSGTEAVLALANAIAWLECSFHQLTLSP